LKAPSWVPSPAGFALLALSVLLAGCAGGPQDREPAGATAGWTRDAELAAVEIVVDLVGAHDGRVPVEIRAMDGNPTHFAVQSAWTGGYQFHDVRFTDASGNLLQHKEEAGRYRVPRTEQKIVVASYEAEPGGAGRHGKQGVVDADHAIFDGRLFLLPQGAVPVGSARIRFVTPAGWSVASPYREDGSWHYVDAFDPELTSKVLGASCMGVGTFDRSVRRVGEMEVRVASYAPWDAAHRRRLEQKTFSMLEYFHDTLGFDLKAPYSVVWVPKQQRRRVFGGSFSNGTCFEHPTDSQRNWELLGHRIAHAMNEYRPSGMQVRDEQDSWFTEGWASYMEVAATEALGLAEPGSRWDTLHASYRRARERTPERDVALGRERSVRDQTREYLHYVKAPLALKMLESWMIARSDRNLEQFMAAMWASYGWFRKPFPFKTELEAFTGASFDDFWSTMVDRRGFVVPVWSEYLTPERRDRMSRPAAVRVGGDPVQGDYLFHLAWSGEFKSFAAIRDHLAREVTRRRELAAAGVQIVPDEIRDHVFALDALDRHALVRLERAYPLLDGADNADPPTVVPNPDQEDGRIFADLLGLERERLAAPRAARIYLRTVESKSARANPARLAFSDTTSVQIAVAGPPELEPAEVLVVSDGRVASRTALAVGTGSQYQASVEPADRPSGSRVITLRVETGNSAAAVSRDYWQRAAAVDSVEPVR